eukprot:jgi/Bigna1/86374/estExt_fgenesh1_pg.C_100064
MEEKGDGSPPVCAKPSCGDKQVLNMVLRPAPRAPICPMCSVAVPIRRGEDPNERVDRHIMEGCPKPFKIQVNIMPNDKKRKTATDDEKNASKTDEKLSSQRVVERATTAAAAALGENDLNDFSGVDFSYGDNIFEEAGKFLGELGEEGLNSVFTSNPLMDENFGSGLAFGPLHFRHPSSSSSASLPASLATPPPFQSTSFSPMTHPNTQQQQQQQQQQEEEEKEQEANSTTSGASFLVSQQRNTTRPLPPTINTTYENDYNNNNDNNDNKNNVNKEQAARTKRILSRHITQQQQQRQKQSTTMTTNSNVNVRNVNTTSSSSNSNAGGIRSSSSSISSSSSQGKGQRSKLRNLAAKHRSKYLVFQMIQSRSRHWRGVISAMVHFFLLHWSTAIRHCRAEEEEEKQKEKCRHCIEALVMKFPITKIHMVASAVISSTSTLSSSGRKRKKSSRKKQHQRQIVMASTVDSSLTPLIAPLCKCAQSVAEAMLMTDLDIAVWSMFLEKLQPDWVSLRPADKQLAALLYAGYSMKLLWCSVEEHQMLIPYLHRVQPNFTARFVEWMQEKKGVKFAIAPVSLRRRYQRFQEDSMVKSSKTISSILIKIELMEETLRRDRTSVPDMLALVHIYEFVVLDLFLLVHVETCTKSSQISIVSIDAANML